MILKSVLFEDDQNVFMLFHCRAGDTETVFSQQGKLCASIQMNSIVKMPGQVNIFRIINEDFRGYLEGA